MMTCLVLWTAACGEGTVSTGGGVDGGGGKGGVGANGGQGGAGGTAGAAGDGGNTGGAGGGKADAAPPADAPSGTDAPPAGDAPPVGPSEICSTSMYAGKTVKDFADDLNCGRKSYAGAPCDSGFMSRHTRVSGLPCGTGSCAFEERTFSDAFTWDDGLAARATAEAKRIASGGSPKGTFTCTWLGYRSFWMAGNLTADWAITFEERAGDGTDPATMQAFALSTGSGGARQGFFYHDFCGMGPVIKRFGIGAACAAGVTWWVVQMGP